jgi:hypothetical protein
VRVGPVLLLVTVAGLGASLLKAAADGGNGCGRPFPVGPALVSVTVAGPHACLPVLISWPGGGAPWRRRV